MKQKLTVLVNSIISLNRLASNPTDSAIMKHEKHIPWLFIILLVGLTEQISVTAINELSETQYRSLDIKYADELHCPYNQSDMPYYNDIMQVPFKFHPLCSSGSISPLFIAQLYTFNLMRIIRTPMLL